MLIIPSSFIGFKNNVDIDWIIQEWELFDFWIYRSDF